MGQRVGRVSSRCLELVAAAGLNVGFVVCFPRGDFFLGFPSVRIFKFLYPDQSASNR